MSAYLERVKRSGLAPRTISGRYFAIHTGSIEWLLDPALIGRLKIGQTNQVSLGDDAILPVRRRLFVVSVQRVKHTAAAGEFNRQNIGVMV